MARTQREQVSRGLLRDLQAVAGESLDGVRALSTCRGDSEAFFAALEEEASRTRGARARARRKATGSYYTPRPIVRFMCREALQDYLAAQLAAGDAAKVQAARAKASALLALPEPDQLDANGARTLAKLLTRRQAAALRRAVLACRVCDPAAGLGAFPAGMLREMVATTAKLDLRLHGPAFLARRHYAHGLKKEIAERCLHGVDSDGAAVQLCRARLGLAVAADYGPDTNGLLAGAVPELPEALGLARHFVHGDSLLEQPVPGADGPAFAWRKDFAAVFAEKGGFDLVLTNPPYVSYYSREAARDERRDLGRLAARYGEGVSGRLNLYLAFVLLSRRLLNPAGRMALILPDTLASNESYARTRRSLWDAPSRIRWVELLFRAFPDAHVRNGVLFASPGGPSLEMAQARRVEDLQAGLAWQPVTPEGLRGDPAFRFAARSRATGELLRTFESSGVVLGAVATLKDGVNPGPREFREAIVAQRSAGDGWREVLTGRDVERFRTKRGAWSIRYEPRLLTRALKKRGASFRDPRIFAARRLVSRQTAKELLFALETSQRPTLNSVHNTMLKPGTPWTLEALLVVLNSAPLNWYYRERFREQRDIFPQVHLSALRALPLPACGPASLGALGALGQAACAEAEAQGAISAATQRRMDAAVARAFGVSRPEWGRA